MSNEEPKAKITGDATESERLAAETARLFDEANARIANDYVPVDGAKPGEQHQLINVIVMVELTGHFGTDPERMPVGPAAVESRIQESRQLILPVRRIPDLVGSNIDYLATLIASQIEARGICP